MRHYTVNLDKGVVDTALKLYPEAKNTSMLVRMALEYLVVLNPRKETVWQSQQPTK